MKAELVKKEGNKVTLKITVDNNKFEEAVNKAYNKTKGKYNIPGFRKGKAPKVVIETQYGKGVFYNDAIDMLFPEVYPEAIKELNIDPIDRPDLDIEEISKDNGLVMVVNVEVKPEFELGAYKGIEISKVDNTVSEEDVEARLNEMVNRNARLTSVEDKALENGDTAVIDFEGFKNGVAFEGGKGENYPLTIGSHSFIPGFEEQLIGMEANEEKDINVTFPEDYHSEDLKGKEVVFKVKVNEVKTVRIPELDEDFFEDLGMDGINSKESLEKQIEENLKTRKEADAENKYIDELLEAAAKNVEVSIPDAMIKDEQDRMIKQYEQNLQMQGLSLEQFFKFTNSDEQALRDQMKEEATKRVTFRLMLEEIIVEEKIVISDEETDKEAVELSKKYQMEKDEFLKQFGGIEMIKYDLEMRKAIDVLKGE